VVKNYILFVLLTLLLKGCSSSLYTESESDNWIKIIKHNVLCNQKQYVCCYNHENNQLMERQNLTMNPPFTLQKINLKQRSTRRQSSWIEAS